MTTESAKNWKNSILAAAFAMGVLVTGGLVAKEVSDSMNPVPPADAPPALSVSPR